ncbi:MAG: extracellular solute-binding protein [Lachnospiraceae bacterium]|jgi:putative aldouronate transport system substrate-binding protein
MKKSAKRIMAASMLAPLLLAGCGGTSDSSTTGSSGTSASTSGSASTSASTTGSSSSGTLESITYMSKDLYSDADYTTKFAELFEADTGVALETIAIPSNGWEDKVTATFMSGELPDIARLPTDLYPFVKQDMLLPLDDYINNNETIKQILEDNPGAITPYQYFGKTYGISISNAKYMTIWVRKDWLDTLGMEMPTTLDEFVEMLRAFKTSDLDGNGEDDTIPLTMPATLQPMDTIAAYFNTRNECYMVDGEPVVPFRTEEYKNFMEFMKSLYDEGLIDQEIPTNTAYSTIREKFNTGTAGAAVMWDDSSSSFINGLASSGIDGEVAYLPAFSNTDGNGALGLSQFIADSPISITTACENPQEAFDTFFEWYLASDDGIISTSVGIEGYNFTIEDGKVVADADKGIGFHGQSFPPVDMDYEYPFEFDDVYTFKYECIQELAESGSTLGDQVNTTVIPNDYTDYANISGDLTSKMQELFHSYLVGNMDYDEYLSQFEAYASEVGLDDALSQ